MDDLVLGPLLRYVDEDSATVWVETNGPAEVTVVVGAPGPGSRHAARTFQVEGHHYALVPIHDLEPERVYTYEVHLDGELVWPRPDDPYPPPVIRTLGDHDVSVAFGSCRAAAPHEPPWTLARGEDDQGRGGDSLMALAERLRHRPHDEWPDLLLMLGDQVYADDASPRTREFIRSRRDTSIPPGEEVADFEEYTKLYAESWSTPTIRWLLSTVPSAMIFDDHDITDDWNISASWLEDMRATDWWDARIHGGLMAYWVYQHLGNLRPREIAENALYERVRAADDAGPVLREFARRADRDPTSHRWSFDRNLGATHVIVTDSRAGRVFPDTGRDMLDEREWAWLTDRIDEPATHKLVASSLPVLLPRAVHDVEAWNERICDGAWGPLLAWLGERFRRAFDLEHWPAFGRSFAHLRDVLERRAASPDPPASLVLLAGDVHHASVTRARFRAPGADQPLWQIVASPLRQEVKPPVEYVYDLATTLPGRIVGRVVSRLAGVDDPGIDWELLDGPIFDNHLATFTAEGEHARVTLEVWAGTEDVPRLRPVVERELA